MLALPFWYAAPGLSHGRWNRRSYLNQAFSKTGFANITTFAIVSPLRLTAETAKYPDNSNSEAKYKEGQQRHRSLHSG